MSDQALLLDTSAFSRFRAGDEHAAEHLGRATRVVMPATVVGELLAGFRLGSHERANRVLLEEFLAEPFVSFAPVTHRTAEHYGRIFFELRRAGTPIPTNDVWIAASCFEHAATLLTSDSDFARVPGLDLIRL